MSSLQVRAVGGGDDRAVEYSFCTLVTRREEYDAMVAAFVAKGFDSGCEYLYVDNISGNRVDAFGAYNRFLVEAKGRYIVLCHQDVLPLHDGREQLDRSLCALCELDSNWGLCGNAGVTAAGKLALHITHGNERREVKFGGPFPKRVMSLDENFIIVRRCANLALSRNLEGFHWYGADLCVIADILGWRIYVVDFHLYHKSRGNADASFVRQGASFRRKYAHAFRSRWHHVPTIQPAYLSASPLRTFIARSWRRLVRQFRSPIPRELR